MSFWQRLFRGSPGNVTPPKSAQSPAPAKLELPQPAEVWVVGKGFLPAGNQIGAALRGFFKKHDYKTQTDHRAIRSTSANGLDITEFCLEARRLVMAKHTDAYYLDIVYFHMTFPVVALVEDAALFPSFPCPIILVSLLWTGEPARLVQRIVEKRQGPADGEAR